MQNRVTQLFNIQYPIIQAGMIWCSGWELASAVSNAGGLGIIGAGSMYPEVLDEHIQKLKKHCDKPYAVNLPLLYPDIQKHVETIIKHQTPIVFTSAGNPATLTPYLKENGVKFSKTEISSKPIQDSECRILLETLEKYNWNKIKTATELNLHRSTLWRKMQKYGISAPS